jgi:hypothetical protein
MNMSVASVFGLLIAIGFAQYSHTELTYNGVTLFLLAYVTVGKVVEWSMLQITNPTEI